MDPVLAAVALAGLVAVSTVTGLVWRARDGRVTVLASSDSDVFSPSDFPGVPSFGERATLVQFSTDICSRCPPTERMLRTVASRHDGVEVMVVDLTMRADLASRFHVLQTPTVLVLDGTGRQLARSGGPPQRAAIETVLASLESRSSHVTH